MATVLPGLLRVNTRSLWTATPRALSCLAHWNHNNFAKINNNRNSNNDGNFKFGKRCSSGIVKGSQVPVMGSPEPRGTIFAVSTGRGKAALSVIRISGPNSFKVSHSCFHSCCCCSQGGWVYTQGSNVLCACSVQRFRGSDWNITIHSLPLLGADRSFGISQKLTVILFL